MFEYQARLLRVVDGDTVDVEVDLGFYLKQEMRLRLNKVDTPEIRGRERPEGLLAKAFVEERLSTAGIIGIRTYKIEKYGRFLADVYYGPAHLARELVLTQGTLLNRELLEQGLADPA